MNRPTITSIRRNIEKFGARLLGQRMQQRIRKLQNTKIEDFMIPAVVTISPSATMADCMQFFAGRNIGSVIVTADDKPVGIVTERDILRKIQEKGASDMQCKEFMTKNIKSLGRRNNFQEAISYSTRNNVRKIPIVDKGSLTGIITLTDMQYLLDSFFRNNDLDMLPHIDSLITDQIVFTDATAKVTTALDRFLQNEADAIIILDGGKMIGILTERDILNEFHTNPAFFQRTPVSALMKTSVISARKDMRIDQANMLMIDHNVRRLPVISGEEVIGIVTQKSVITAAHTLLTRLSDEII